MNWDRAEGQWVQFKGKVLEHWGVHINSEAAVVRGQQTQLIGSLQEEYGACREAARAETKTGSKRASA